MLELVVGIKNREVLTLEISVWLLADPLFTKVTRIMFSNLIGSSASKLISSGLLLISKELINR